MSGRVVVPIFAAALVAAPMAASAHGANPAVAWMNDPFGVGNVVDDEFTFTWIDFDMSIPTGTATIDFFYTARRPPAYANGDIHALLEGESVVSGIIEKDLNNRYTWDTTSVPAGSYFLWSKVIEPPDEMMAPQIISFSPGVLTIAHPGDPVHPALIITAPDTPFRFANQSYTIKWAAFDPDQTGRVKIEVGTSSMGVGYETLADDLAPDLGELEWDTSDLEEVDWYIRGTITDDRGLSFTAYSEFFLIVSHTETDVDAGVRDSGSTSDAGVIADAGGTKGPPPAEGCTCATPTDHSGAGAASLALLIVGWAARTRSRRRARR